MKKLGILLGILILTGCSGGICMDNDDSMCGLPDIDLPIDLPIDLFGDQICNMAASFSFCDMMPIDIPFVCKFSIDIGTCMEPGGVGEVCAEDADCESISCDIDAGQCL